MLNKLSIKWQLLISFIILSVSALLLLWVFQIVLLDTFYQNIKLQTTSQLMEEIVEITDDTSITAYYDDSLEWVNTAVKIEWLNEISELLKANESTLAISNSADFRQMWSYTSSAPNPQLLTNYGSIRTQLMGSMLDSDNFSGIINISTDVTQAFNTIIVAKTLTIGDTEIVLIINSALAPVGATVSTLKTQLLIISAILIPIAAIISLIMSSRISSPIIQLNASAKNLAQGKYSTPLELARYSEAVELDASFQLASKEIARTEYLQRELIANISHDLRTPLTIISGNIEIFRDNPELITTERLNIIAEETNRLALLINDILDLSKVQVGSVKFNDCRLNLSVLIQDTISRLSSLNIDKDFKLHLNGTSSDIYIFADELRISQVLYNLITNAITYAKEDMTITINEIILDKAVRIEVINSGETLSEDILKDIWHRYYTTATHTRAICGTGIGLSIVREILNHYDITYGVTSIDNITTFFFEFPICL